MLTSRRLVLEPLTVRQLEAVHALWMQPGVRRYLWDDEIISQERAAEPLRASELDFRERGFGLWGIYLRPISALLGFCGLRQADVFPEPELLFGMDDGQRGRGLAFEAATTVLACAFDRLQLARIGAATDVANTASSRLLDRLGMQLLRRGDHHGLETLFYGLTRAEWILTAAGPSAGMR